ncbi:hypothetical protein VNO77_33633 [Canavalia gladiata]|uniref:Uncharacterized protein n=1 Tax=Canavalia gladiata TaxID=3824 RepID=A0AAN9KES6_CANGL
MCNALYLCLVRTTHDVLNLVKHSIKWNVVRHRMNNLLASTTRRCFDSLPSIRLGAQTPLVGHCHIGKIGPSDDINSNFLTEV